MTEQVAVARLYEWFKENIGLFSSKRAQTEFRDSGKGRAYVRLDTPEYMTELLVWDEKYDLTIDVINMETDENTVPFRGECETLEEFNKQLDGFLKWFEETHVYVPD